MFCHPSLGDTVLAGAGCAAPGAGVLCGIPARAACGPGRTVPELCVCDHRSSSQHFISEMKLWHVLSEARLLQARDIPIRSDPGVQAPSQLALCFND